MVADVRPRRSVRIEVRMTPADRALIDRAVRANGSHLTEFVVTHLKIAARRVLADRNEFTLSAEAAEEWEKINDRPAQDLPGLRALMSRPSPFIAE